MARVPVITSHCPFRWNSLPQPGQDFCGQCERRVHNLDLMSASERQVFLAGCSGKVCVSYTVRRPVSASLALSALAAAATLGGSANAEDPQLVVMPDSPYCEEEQVLMGSTETGNKLQWVDETEAALPDKAELPEITAATWLPTPKA